MAVAQARDVAQEFDPFNLNAPHAIWNSLREERPVFFHDPTGYFVVTRHADIKAVFDDEAEFEDSINACTATDYTITEE